MSLHPDTVKFFFSQSNQLNDYQMEQSSFFTPVKVNDTIDSVEMQSDSTTMSEQFADEFYELQQIEYEQRLVRERLFQIDMEKQRLRQLLNILQSTKFTSKSSNVKQYPYESANTDSDSDSETDCDD